VDDETRRLLSLAEKIVLRTSEFKDHYTRTLAALLEMASSPQFLAFMSAIRARVPEIEELLSESRDQNALIRPNKTRTLLTYVFSSLEKSRRRQFIECRFLWTMMICPKRRPYAFGRL
jgi:hypothetical protein